MILVDTSVWIDHLRVSNPHLVHLLESTQVMAHPFIIGEIALGHLRQRDTILHAIGRLPQVQVAADFEVLHLIREKALFGSGIGYIDAHLLASLRLTPGARLWTRDQRLDTIANQFGLAAT